jgi:glycerol-1-phosphate dehydrogenase [NAD(P)+]
MAAHLRAAGAPADPVDIGLTMADLRRATLAARFLRSRYTVLDLLDDTGLLSRAVAEALPDGPRAKIAE